MHIQNTSKFICAALLGLLLTACGGGSSSPLDSYSSSSATSSSNTSGANNSSSTSSIDSVTPTHLGYGSGDTFIEGQIGVGIGSDQLSAGGSTTLTVNIVSPTNTLVTSDVEVNFNSKCVASGEATLTNELGESTKKITAVGGEATIIYTAKGCVGDDLITANASLNQFTKEAQATLTIAQGTLGSIKFIDATPTLISLAGTGGQETSIVRFQVLSDSSNNDPLKDVDVTFKLNTTVGGTSLSSSTAKTDKQGYATTTVKAGTIHTSVRVTATAATDTITKATQSDRLVISTGIPDQDSMTIAATLTNPVGWNIEGVESVITARLADAFNNPPPVGTSVAFTTEGGSIDDSCQTDSTGACSVTWRSQNPKALRNSNDYSANRLLCVDDTGIPLVDYATCRKERAGRATVLASAIGNESFIDSDGKGTYIKDSDDIFISAANYSTSVPCDINAPISSYQTPSGNTTVTPCDDLGEAYTDKNENGMRDSNEEFLDFNENNNYDKGNDIYNGILCSDDDALAGNCTKDQVTIRQDMVLVVTSENILLKDGKLPFIDDAISVGTGMSNSTWFWLADENGNGVPNGTTISVDTSDLIDGKASISPKGPLAASDDPTLVTLSISAASEDKAPSGSVYIKITRTAPAPVGQIINEYSVSVVPAP